MKVFGKTLFERKVTPKLYDFAQHGLLRMSEGYGMELTQEVFTVQAGETAPGVKKPKPKKEKEAIKLTPKGVFELKTLNKPEFAINCDPEYLNAEIEVLTGKLEVLAPTPSKKKKRGDPMQQLVSFDGGAVKYGRQEVASMKERLENRRLYKTYQDDFSEWPYTTNDAIREVLDKNKHLEARPADAMVPDLPKDAISAIKAYTTATEAVSGKRPVFYLIAEKKDQGEVARKRDPILLAQSPFGFFWQILGAWDKEVVLLDEL